MIIKIASTNISVFGKKQLKADLNHTLVLIRLNHSEVLFVDLSEDRNLGTVCILSTPSARSLQDKTNPHSRLAVVFNTLLCKIGARCSTPVAQ